MISVPYTQEQFVAVLKRAERSVQPEDIQTRKEVRADLIKRLIHEVLVEEGIITPKE